MVNWEDKDIKKWQEEAREIQQDFYERLGDREWDHFKSDERWALEKKTGYALFGEPTEEPNVNNKYGYNEKNTEEIIKFTSLIYQHNGSQEIYIAFLFVYGKAHENRFCVPLFRIKSSLHGVIYIDQYGRVYKDWADYENSNTLPKSILCYPRGGYYHAIDDEVRLTFKISPACTKEAKVCSALDTTATAVTVGSLVTGIIGMAFPIAAPIVVLATYSGMSAGIYSVFRGSQHLIDRGQHKQSISLDDRDARNCWLSILGSALGVGSGLAVRGMVNMAASGQVLGKAGRIAVNMMTYGSLTINGFGIANDLANLIEKNERNELTTLDVFQFATSVFFFTNTVINTKTAGNIIREVQNDVLHDYRSDLASNRRRKAFDKVTRKGEGTLQGNANVIKGITNAESKDEFFRLLIKAQKTSKTTKFNQDGKLEVKGALFQDIRRGPVPKVKNINQVNFASKITENNFKYTSPSSLKTEVGLYVRICSDINKNVITINSNTHFKFSGTVLEGFSDLCFKYSISQDKECISNLLDETVNFAREKGCMGEVDFNDFAEFLIIYKQILLKNKMLRYEKEKAWLKEELGENFNESELYEKWEIKDPNCANIALQKLVDEEIRISTEVLSNTYDSLKEEVTAINQDGDVKFISNLVALNNFYRNHLNFEVGLTPYEFFDIIREVIRNDIYKIHSANHDADYKYTVYINEDIPVVVETLEKNNEKFFHSVNFTVLSDK